MSDDQQQNANIVVYLLHFDAPFKGRQHYVGSTLYDRRFKRWREHAQGNGSHYVRRFIREGIGFRVVRLWFSPTRALEKSVKGRAQFSKICPICTPSLPQPEPIHFGADAWSPTISAHWLNRKRPPHVA